MNKVLMIAYLFPPLKGAGIHRTAKFVKYLPIYGWEPVVVCADDPLWPRSKNDSAASLGQKTEVKRVRFFPIASWIIMPIEFAKPLYRFAKQIFRKVKPQVQSVTQVKDQGESVCGGAVGDKGFCAAQPLNYFGRLDRHLWNLLRIPDDRIYWLPGALFVSLIKVLKDRDIKVVYSTSCPFTDHIVALLLKAIIRKPWVADFRDPWTSNVIAFGNRPRWFMRISERLERAVLKSADRVVVVADSIADGFIKKHPEVKRDKFITITNGFDSNDFLSIRPKQEAGFTISYIGELYASRVPTDFLLAFKTFIKEVPDADARLWIVGSRDEGSESIIKTILEDSELKNRVFLDEYVPHKKALEYMLSSDALIFVLGENEQETGGIYPGKLFEYLAARKPIIGITPDGASARLVKELGAGIICSNGDIEGITNAFKKVFIEPLIYMAKPEQIDRFDRKVLTEKLASVFDEVSNKRDS